MSRKARIALIVAAGIAGALFFRLLLPLALAEGIKTFIAQPFVIPSAAMSPTILPGDRVIASKRSGPPRRGDIVVFRDPTGRQKQLIKRVVALPGDTVDIRGDALLVNGVRLREPYVAGRPTPPGTVPMPVKLRAGELWVMGDNRTNSEDSRYFGPIELSSVIGKAIAIYYPSDRARWL